MGEPFAPAARYEVLGTQYPVPSCRCESMRSRSSPRHFTLSVPCRSARPYAGQGWGTFPGLRLFTQRDEGRMIPVDLSGKVALVTGVGDNESFAWFISKALRAAGARLAWSVHPRFVRIVEGFLTSDKEDDV